MSSYSDTIKFIRELYPNKKVIALHEPKFKGNERKYVLDAIDSTFVSSVGKYVDDFEARLAQISGARKAVAVVNGTSGIQTALRLLGVNESDEVLTQALTFIATANAILYNKAVPVFLDVDYDTMGLSPVAVSNFLEAYGELRNDGCCYNKKTGRKISACLPMHTFGFPVNLDELIKVCTKWNIPIIEDAAEAIGSKYHGVNVGTFGRVGIFSFNGNKIVTGGGGGGIVTNDESLAIRAKHLTTTAKIPHRYEYCHDELGYNFRMPNINAALLCAQLEQLDTFLAEKRKIANLYSDFFELKGITFRKELPNTTVNYWLMCIEMNNREERDLFLEETNNNNIMTRPIWQLLFKSPIYSKFYRDDQINAIKLENTIVNVPSSVR